ncbi:MAG: hypothetical protein HAW60_05025 [Bdellovibrionales bacterium]|nr:hypothetical protein [Bdellovibrionales bacterium]
MKKISLIISVLLLISSSVYANKGNLSGKNQAKINKEINQSSVFTDSGFSLSTLRDNIKNLKKDLKTLIRHSGVLMDFGYGDDWVECGEYEFSISEINFEKRIIQISLYQGNKNRVCQHNSPIIIDIKYQFENNKKKQFSLKILEY